jgi:phosphoglycerate kinase
MKTLAQIERDDYIFDVGPKTLKIFSGIIKKANTIVWNGPLGMFENEKFKHGTFALARLVAGRASGRAFGLVGGGETIEAFRAAGIADYVDWISTGGGAMLAYLGGEKMPGLKGIIK